MQHYYNITYYGARLRVDDDGNIYTADGKKLKQSPVKTNTAGNNYLSVNINGKNVLAHRICAYAFYGVPARGQVCDHCNGIKSDNRKINIRWISRRDNALNRHSYGECRLPRCADYSVIVDGRRMWYPCWRKLAEDCQLHYGNFKSWLKIYKHDMVGRPYHGIMFESA